MPSAGSTCASCRADRASTCRNCSPAVPLISAWVRTISFRFNIVKAGAPIRAVAAIFQKDPQVLITHPRGDIKKLADMKGKPIMISDAATTAFWPWLKAKFGFQDSQIRKYTFNLAPFLVDPEAIQEGYVTSEPYTIEKQGKFKTAGLSAGRQRLSGHART